MRLTLSYTFQVTNTKLFKQPVFSGPPLAGFIRYNDGVASKQVPYGTKTGGAVLGSASLFTELDAFSETVEVRYQKTVVDLPGGTVTIVQPWTREHDGVPVLHVLVGHECDSILGPTVLRHWEPLWKVGA
jgi:hypothetical protein